MQERAEPPHQTAGRLQGTESEREKDTHLQLYCLVQSVRLALTATSILSSPSLSVCGFTSSLKLSLSHTHTHLNTLIHSAHSQARVRQPHISPCSAPGWEDRALQGAAITGHRLPQLNQVWRCLNAPRRLRCLFGTELQSFDWHPEKRETGNTGSWTQREILGPFEAVVFALLEWLPSQGSVIPSSHVPAYRVCVRQLAQRRPASCRLLVQGAPWESDPSCANGHAPPLVFTPTYPGCHFVLFSCYACRCCFWLVLLSVVAHLRRGMTPFRRWHRARTARGLWSGTRGATTT